MQARAYTTGGVWWTATLGRQRCSLFGVFTLFLMMNHET